MATRNLLFLVLGIHIALWGWLAHRMFRHLALKHPDKYQEFGHPKVLSSSVKSNLAMTRFFYLRQYVSLHDSELSRIARLMWMLILTYTTTIVLLFYVG